jgi:hypothetical protein
MVRLLSLERLGHHWKKEELVLPVQDPFTYGRHPKSCHLLTHGMD